jgi:hypothetical protein
MNIKLIFLLSVGAVQLLDTVSTYVALKYVQNAYEANGIIAVFLHRFGPASIFIYEAVLMLALIGATELMDRYLHGPSRAMLYSFYVGGFIFLVLHRFFFVVLNNWRVIKYGT